MDAEILNLLNNFEIKNQAVKVMLSVRKQCVINQPSTFTVNVQIKQL